ncbi:MAG: c-type cytochrome biogenesis protein CcsB [Frankiales bacterium]|nr:c-type cytochrome biogenesis protein CcsB [Frankiales bacterium]
MAAYTIAMIAFAASLAATRGRDLVPAGTAAGAEGAGGVAVATRVETTVGGPDDGALPPGRRAGNIGMATMWAGTALLFAGVLLRGLSVGRAPWGNMCEFSMTSALGVAIVFLVISLRRDVRWMGLFVAIPVLLALGSAMTFLYTDAEQLVPALKSYWLLIHVSAAVICGGAFCVGAAVTVLFLVADSAERAALAGRSYRLEWLARRLPESGRLDAMAYRIHAFMFPLWTFAIVAGAIWAENAWGRYWGWDPKETWAFITWVAYAAYLHARATVGWKGRKAAVVALIAFGCFLFNYFGVNIFITGLHSYAGV